jgi:hypothetical protein
VPRWLVVNVVPAIVTLELLSIAGLPVINATVWVKGPPLLRKPFGSSLGSKGEVIVPLRSVDAVKSALPSFLPIRCDISHRKAGATLASEALNFERQLTSSSTASCGSFDKHIMRRRSLCPSGDMPALIGGSASDVIQSSCVLRSCRACRGFATSFFGD